MHSDNPVQTIRRIQKNFPLEDSPELITDDQHQARFAAKLQELAESLRRDQTGTEIIDSALAEYLPPVLESHPDTAHIIDAVAHMGAERYRIYCAHAFRMIYNGGRTR